MSKSITWLGIKNNPLTIYPMIIFGDVNPVIDGMWTSSKSLKSIDRDRIEIRTMDEVELDPGGSVFTKIPHIKFELDGYKLSIHAYKIDEVLYRVKRCEERLPGIMRFRLWFWNFMMEKDLHQKLIAKLEELNKSDEAIHAEITFMEQVEKLEATKSVIFFRRPEDH